ncbi:MAG: ankyrin repeat domain-containing protein [Runella slithyformis]|jgi:uncharacterized protein|nr:MAG: ankyrin repeat domain-containing protein [Runella slithyformis]TAF31027.1 MAG: ankyrin repeat domain-containing protein [Cytophagales bacterium]TAF43652.1 MAG: ankyrin repeat domain-containing protein [Runella slithyformis]
MKKEIKLSNKITQAVYNQTIINIDSELKALINVPDKDGRTLLFHAVIAENLDLVERLVNENAIVNLSDNLLWTPLHYAAHNYSIDILKYLISKNANVNAQDKYGNSVLWRAVFDSKGREGIIKLLIENGAIKTLKNNFDVSPLDLADKIANYDLKQFFL